MGLDVEAAGTVHFVANLSKNFPALNVDGYAYTEAACSADISFPMLKIDAVISQESIGNGAVVFPSMLCSSLGLCGEIGSLSETIACLTCSATEYSSCKGDFDSSWPALDVAQSKGLVSGRFTDYVLRYIE